MACNRRPTELLEIDIRLQSMGTVPVPKGNKTNPTTIISRFAHPQSLDCDGSVHTLVWSPYENL
jgi:hypothetical protein